MVATRQTYAITPPPGGSFGASAIETALRSALIGAGLMTDWHASFATGDLLGRVMEIQYDGTKTYGKSYYYFIISSNTVGVALADIGWSGLQPTGERYLDWHKDPPNMPGTNLREWTTILFEFASLTSNAFLERYTSGSDPRQSWFVFRQPANLTRSNPFAFLHKDSTLHSWIDLNKGCISGLARAKANASNRAGVVRFVIDENLRRCFGFGSSLRGTIGRSGDLGNTVYHNIDMNIFAYCGVGTAADGAIPNGGFGFTPNFPNSSGVHGSISSSVPLPIGKNSANPAYIADYIPIVSDIAWSYYTPAKLAQDFGIFMQYADNDIGILDRVIVQSAVNEWEVLDFSNNAIPIDGASPSFLARVV